MYFIKSCILSTIKKSNVTLRLETLKVIKICEIHAKKIFLIRRFDNHEGANI